MFVGVIRNTPSRMGIDQHVSGNLYAEPGLDRRWRIGRIKKSPENKNVANSRKSRPVGFRRIDRSPGAVDLDMQEIQARSRCERKPQGVGERSKASIGEIRRVQYAGGRA